MRRHTWRNVALALLGCGFLLWATSGWWLYQIGAYLVHSDSPAKADAILVLGGDWSGNRVLKAAKLASEGWAPVVVVSGPMLLYGINEADLAVRYAVSKGFPESMFEKAIIPSTSTRDEASKLRSRFEGVRRLLIVTSNFHTRRAGNVWRGVLPGTDVRVIASSYPEFEPATWWKQRPGQKTVFQEWTKTVAYWVGM